MYIVAILFIRFVVYLPRGLREFFVSWRCKRWHEKEVARLMGWER